MQQRILKWAKKKDVEILDITDGGLNETNVPSVHGDKTKNKSDLKVILSNGEVINISVKKSLGGQVYLITADRFITGFEKIYLKEIPEKNIIKANIII